MFVTGLVLFAAASLAGGLATSPAWLLAAGFDRAFLVAAGISVLIVLVTVIAIRIRRSDLAGR